MTHRRGSEPVDAAARREVVAFLREWLPEAARIEYRAMMEADPAGWHTHPHFAGGVIPEHALRGNGIDERVLNVADLDDVWPELLRQAVQEDGSPGPA